MHLNVKPYKIKLFINKIQINLIRLYCSCTMFELADLDCKNLSKVEILRIAYSSCNVYRRNHIAFDRFDDK